MTDLLTDWWYLTDNTEYFSDEHYDLGDHDYPNDSDNHDKC